MSITDAIYINLGQMVYNRLCELLKVIEEMNSDNQQDTHKIDEMIIKQIFNDQYKNNKIKRKKLNKYTQTQWRGTYQKKSIINQVNYKYSCKKCLLKFKSNYYLQKHQLYDGKMCRETVKQNNMLQLEESKDQDLIIIEEQDKQDQIIEFQDFEIDP